MNHVETTTTTRSTLWTYTVTTCDWPTGRNWLRVTDVEVTPPRLLISTIVLTE